MIFTIGYSNRNLPEFLHELSSRGVRQLWDVRSSPWSRNASFNASQITKWSERASIYYRQCGEVLGGRSEIAVDDPIYIDLLSQLITTAKRDIVAVMCAEGDPALCHRSWDIGASLFVNSQVNVTSILRDGTNEDIGTTLNRIRRGNFSPAILAALDNVDPMDWPEKSWLC